VLTTTTGCHAGACFDNEVIPPGAPRPQLPWAYTYAQFDQLLQAYSEVHPEDFVTFGILQEQPRRGSCREWGEVAGILSPMIGRRRLLVNELVVINNRIDRLDGDDPMRVTEEQALVAVLLRKRRCSVLPLGDGAFAQLAAPGGPLLLNQAHQGPRETPVVALYPHRRRRDLHLGHQAPKRDSTVPLHLSLGHQEPRGDV